MVQKASMFEEAGEFKAEKLVIKSRPKRLSIKNRVLICV